MIDCKFGYECEECVKDKCTKYRIYHQGRADTIDKIVDMYNSNPDIDAFTLVRNLLKEKNNE